MPPLDEKWMMTNNNNNKKSGTAEKNTHKFPSPTNFHNGNKAKEQQQQQQQPSIDRKTINESEIDMENLPVIQGSFEITKTDADITEKRESNVNTNKRAKPSTLKPFVVSPASIKIKSNQPEPTSAGVKEPNVGSVERTKVERPSVKSTTLQPVKEVTFSTKIASLTITNAPESTTTTTTTSTTTTTTTTTEVPTTTSERMSSSSEENELGSTEKLLETTLPEVVKTMEFESNEHELPKLTANLFTSAPILDHEPWRPINAPLGGASHDYEARIPYLDDPIIAETASLATERPYYVESMLHRNKFHDPENIMLPTSSGAPVYYQSYNNPTFVDAHTAIEKLGTIDVKPYPLPVNKISQEDIPDFKYLSPTMIDEQDTLYDSLKLAYDADKFEHLGGGVIVKKAETTHEPAPAKNDTLEDFFMMMNNATELSDNKTEETLIGANINEILLTLLDLDSRNQTESLPTAGPEVVSGMWSSTSGELPAPEPTKQQSGEMLSSELEKINQDPFVMQRTPLHPPGDEIESIEMVTEFLEGQMNATEKSHIKNATFELSNVSVETMKTSSENPTTSYVEVDTIKNTPVSLELFPANFQSNPKWEFVNGSGIATTGNSQMKRVYNDTLQAWIVENSQMPPMDYHKEYPSPQPTVAAQHNENLQNISTIFDTLASKLGIKQETLSKPPPFSASSQTKLKNNSANKTMLVTKDQPATPSGALGSHVVTEVSIRYEGPKTQVTNAPKTPKPIAVIDKETIRIVQTETPRPVTTTKRTTKRATTKTKKPAKSARPSTTKKPKVTTTKPAATTPTLEKTSTKKFYLETSPLILESSSEQIVGQAEIIEIDPTQYTELLRMASSAPLTTTTSATTTSTEISPSLITLLPVKSNSGLRTFNPRFKPSAPGGTGVGSSSVVSSEVEPRKIGKLPLMSMETIVRTSMSVGT
jgi:hypothetical protein